jgi:4-methyl-5(b-hydroxyethyl)-thiazole monophosphate biosynthesis
MPTVRRRVLDRDERVTRIDASSFDALVIPGGFHSKGFDEIYDPAVHELVRAIHDDGKPIATMCVGILAVAQAGVLAGGKATTYPLSSRHDNPGQLREFGCEALEEPIVDWNGIISCSGPAYSEQVMSLLLEKLVGTQAAREVKRYRAGYPLRP